MFGLYGGHPVRPGICPDRCRHGCRYDPGDLHPRDAVCRLHRRFEKDTILTLGNYDFHCIHTPGHTPGSISVMVEIEGRKVLFGQDLHGPFEDGFLSNLNDYQSSMEKLLDLNADILCEGHLGIFQPKDQVRTYIETCKSRNQP